ncbi:hypothetical protein LINPERHAP2_LOCUS23802 [Linum perenne]
MSSPGSLNPKVSEKSMIMHEECLEGNYRSVEKLRTGGPGAGIHQHKREVWFCFWLAE